MNQKEVRELKRRFRPDKNAISRIYGCFVDPNRRIISYLDESLGLMPEDEVEKYLNLLKKTLSGTLGKNLIDIVFSTQQVVDSPEHRLLTRLRDTQHRADAVRFGDQADGKVPVPAAHSADVPIQAVPLGLKRPLADAGDRI